MTVNYSKIPTRSLITEADALFSELSDTLNDEHQLAIFRELLVRLSSLDKKIDEWRQDVELPIVMRTHFTGDEPYVGTRGLGLAVNEAMDDLMHHKDLMLKVIATFDITAYYIMSDDIDNPDSRKPVADAISEMTNNLKQFAMAPIKKPFKEDLRSKFKVIKNENFTKQVPSDDGGEE